MRFFFLINWKKKNHKNSKSLRKYTAEYFEIIFLRTYQQNDYSDFFKYQVE